ncbi:hypothetical protein F0L68_41010 [Solihabitans fulvus]|uniref:Mce-associated membrane protein n=1 Tax=Solihabitans fulvus TaxID=1892852 RepID=A0A5B2W1V8_9PSEU|nr:hypothetical protein [Solihabitans fulvus]KAA2245943.1 hypothetical protein F0L68_41010 [Solihabitans fulvus]
MAGCSTPAADSTQTPSPAATPQPSITFTPTSAAVLTPPTSSSGVGHAATAEDVATRWLAALRAARWTDGSPAAWVDRVRPYVTDALHGRDQLLRDAGGGADWRAFVQGQCASTVTDLRAIRPPESPGTSSAAQVQVSGTVRTSCDAATAQVPAETATATLLIVQVPDGSWRVDQRL